MAVETRSVLERIREMLNASGAVYREIKHEATLTSEDSARARGEELRVGGKALVLKTGDAFRLFVLSAARKLDSGAVKEKFGVKKVRFATADELLTLTGLVPGSVPPFGQPVLPFELYIDPSVIENGNIAFNAGSLTDSMVMRVEDYIAIANGEQFRFSV